MNENQILNVEYLNSGSNIQQHYQQHFQQHYAVAASSNLDSASSTQPFPTSLSEDNVQNKALKEKQEKKTVQTTTTTTIAEPILISEDQFGNFTLGRESVDRHSTYLNHNPIYTIPIERASDSGIHVEHYPENKHWTNMDTYLHIFLTFYFGHFAAILFFDGIVRNIGYLSVFGHHHTLFSPFIFILELILSICLLAFTIWFLTICWRWWRNKSLQPIHFDKQNIAPKQRAIQFHAYVFTAAIILIISFFVYLILGILSLSFKYHVDQKFGRQRKSFFTVDLGVFVFRIIFWIVGIVATLFLSRDILYKYCCPGKLIRINKEKPTSVYEIKA
ncbi:hypothetical protein BpHYR1_051282 [Brachionus plicatilis]|uniref:Uncharacterized protein n=1 Tax=Brachionus plicatilis TaxID=10195 RepID=A0A3M7S8P4_BRAPC|nr:hypothetical protein BpHYR1_051282 [Brachionus plicatilis]